MDDRWFRDAVIYCADVQTFQDSDGDGTGDFRGLSQRLDYLDRLGITCLWLNPIHPSPRRDGGYDVTDYYDVHPDLGTLGDFAEFLGHADNRGIRVIIDLVVNHTSDEHPWFRSACAGPDAPRRDWYVWSEEEPVDKRQGVVFPGEQATTWTYHEDAGAWYFHRFYDFQPDLNIANPEVVAEIERIMAFWLRLGVSGFRMDAAPFLIEEVDPKTGAIRRHFDLLTELREAMAWKFAESLILAEANVPAAEVPDYFGDGHRLPMLFNFALNQQTFLALADREAAPIRHALRTVPAPARGCQWATFLRNHDEVDLSALLDSERARVFAAFGPKEEMQLYGRGIRRRLAPMLGGDRRRIEMAYALQCTLPGTPVIRYGEEIGMGDDLSLPEREAIRTPMQWSDEANGGFSTAAPEELFRPVITKGRFGTAAVNVSEQRRDAHSLLTWMQRMLRTLRECPEFGRVQPRDLESGVASVLALLYDDPAEGTMLAVTNLGERKATLDLAEPLAEFARCTEYFADGPYDAPDLGALAVTGYGYRWLRLHR